MDWSRDLHFQTRTTIDTLDYSGSGLNAGSKLVIAAAGRVRRELPTEIPADLLLPEGFNGASVCLPGVLAVSAPPWKVPAHHTDPIPEEFCQTFSRDSAINQFPLIVLVDDARFCGATLSNFLWTVFTRSNPASDVYGIDSFMENKHFGCHGSLVVDARLKTHHAPPLECDPQVSARVDDLFSRGKSLHSLG